MPTTKTLTQAIVLAILAVHQAVLVILEVILHQALEALFLETVTVIAVEVTAVAVVVEEINKQ